LILHAPKYNLFSHGAYWSTVYSGHAARRIAAHSQVVPTFSFLPPWMLKQCKTPRVLTL
jgi:hypothetical protein